MSPIPYEITYKDLQDAFAHAEDILLLQEIVEIRLSDYSRVRISPNRTRIVQTTNVVTEAYGAGSADYFSITLEVWEVGSAKPILVRHEEGGYDERTYGFRYAEFSKDSRSLLLHYHDQSHVIEVAIE